MRWAILSLAAAAALTLSAGDASAQWRGHGGGYRGGYNTHYYGGYGGGYRYNYPRYNYGYSSPRYYGNYGYGYRPGLFLGLGLGTSYYSPWGSNYGWGNGYNPYYGNSWYW